jgi:hemerythrin-like domain-containing protein
MAKSAKPDAITLLQDDHARIKRLLMHLQNSQTRQREALLDEIESEIKIHNQIEAEIFFVELCDVAQQDAISGLFEGLQERHLIDVIMPNLKATPAGSKDFIEKAELLHELVRIHSEEEEENRIFPEAKKLMGTERLLQLGAALQARDMELRTIARAGQMPSAPHLRAERTRSDYKQRTQSFTRKAA